MGLCNERWDYSGATERGPTLALARVPSGTLDFHRLGSVLACWFVGRGPKTGVLSRTVFWVWGGFLGLGEVRDLYRKVGDIGGLHFHQVPSKSVPRGAKTSQKTVYLRIPSEQTTCCFLQARTEPRTGDSFMQCRPSTRMKRMKQPSFSLQYCRGFFGLF